MNRQVDGGSKSFRMMTTVLRMTHGKVDSDSLEAALTDNPKIFTRKLRSEFGISLMTIQCHLKNLGKVSKFRK